MLVTLPINLPKASACNEFWFVLLLRERFCPGKNHSDFSGCSWPGNLRARG